MLPWLASDGGIRPLKNVGAIAPQEQGETGQTRSPVKWNDTHTQPFYCPLFGSTQVSWYCKKHSPSHIYSDHQPSFISFLHLLQSTASSVFNLNAWQSFCTTSLYVLLGLSLGLELSNLYSVHFFTQSLSSFHNICPHCPYYCNLLNCSTEITSSDPSLSQLFTWNSISYLNVTQNEIT